MYDWTDRWMYAIQIDTVQPSYSAELWSLYIDVANVSCAWRLQLQGCPLRSSLEKLSPAAVAPGLSEFCIWRVWPRHGMQKRRRSFEVKKRHGPHGRRGLRVARSRTDCGEAAILQNGHGKGFPRWIHWDFRFQSNFLTSNTFYHFLQLFAF